jgi:CheY-like chemotaxis protein
MNLESELIAIKTAGHLPVSEKAALSCRLAKQLEKRGEYEKARDALIEFWPGSDALPKLEGLDDAAKADVLLRIGALTGWIGSVTEAGRSQESAKDLITQSIEIFEELGLSEKIAEARTDLAICYWREGAFDEARISLASGLSLLTEENDQARAVILIWSGLVEGQAGRLHKALHFYDEAAALIEGIEDHAIKGTFHNQFGLIFRRLATPANREDYLDRALIEYAAASFHFEKAGNSRYLASVENNLGFLFFTLGRYTNAHTHLNRAGDLFRHLGDEIHRAQVNDTRARVLLAEGRLPEAERLVRSVVRTLERGDEQAVLAEALTTYGTVLARLGRYARAKELLNRAIGIAETVGDLEGAGRAKLSIIEELSKQTPPMEMASTFEAAAELLQQSQDPTTSKRLIACARKVIAALGASEPAEEELNLPLEHSFSLRNEVRGKEKALIEKALRDAGGSVTKAAHLLGFKHHQSLISLINSRHPDLLNVRSAVRRRRSHMFSKSKKLRRRVPPAPPAPRRSRSQVSIFHAEDNKLVGQLVHDLVTAENWKIDLCTDGDTALKKLTGDEPYDVLVVDNDLPGLSGVELIQRARKITHRRRTPIVMVSGDDYESEAWRAGADAFLKKPEEIGDLPTTITRLLRERSSER